jgi:hypothetical protein
MLQEDVNVTVNIFAVQRNGASNALPRSVHWYLVHQCVHLFFLNDFTDILFQATREQNVEHGKIRITKSLAKEIYQVSDSVGLAFIEGIDNKYRRWTLAQPGLQVP